LEYAIKNAIASEIFDEIVVSTDSEEIAEFAVKCGAKIPYMRNKELSGDFVGTDSVVLDAIDIFKSKGVQFDFIAGIYPTTPFLEPTDLINGLTKMIQTKSDFLLTVCKLRFPLERVYVNSHNGLISPSDKSFYLERSQDLPEYFFDAGQFSWGTWEGWKNVSSKGIISCSYLELPWNKGIDLDNLSDWYMAEQIYQSMNNTIEN